MLNHRLFISPYEAQTLWLKNECPAKQKKSGGNHRSWKPDGRVNMSKCVFMCFYCPLWGRVFLCMVRLSNLGLHKSLNQCENVLFTVVLEPSYKPNDLMYLSKVECQKWNRGRLPNQSLPPADSGLIRNPAEEKELKVKRENGKTKMKWLKVQKENNIAFEMFQHIFVKSKKAKEALMLGSSSRSGLIPAGHKIKPLNDSDHQEQNFNRH